MNKKFIKKILFIFLFLLIFLLLLFSVIFSLLNINNTKILSGISINGIDVSNLSKEEAKSILSKKIDEKQASGLEFLYPNATVLSKSFDSLGITYNISNSINKAYNIGRSSNIFKNNLDIFKLFFNKKNIQLDINIDSSKQNYLIQELSANVEDRINDSSYYIENTKLILIKGTDGNSLNTDLFTNSLNSVLSDLSNNKNKIYLSIEFSSAKQLDIDTIYNEIYKEPKNAYYEINPLKIYPEIIGITFDKNAALDLLKTDQKEYEIDLIFNKPEITLSDLDINIFQDKLASFSTKYNVSNLDRSNNLSLAASKINGTIIAPGEDFSYNKTVGARTIAAGYKEAKIYSNGEVVDGIGGGICQISSTLYNACVFANLDILERHNHQFLTSYVEAGRDATVAYGSKDFKFKNTRSYPIKINFSVDKGIALCEIFGIKEETEYTITFDIEKISVTEPPISYEQDDSLSYGVEKIIQRGANGALVNVYKKVTLNDKLISRTLISQDSYKPLEKIILKNSVE